MKRFLTPILIVLFALGFLVRLYRFDNPVADWHAFRQSDTNAVSQIFADEGVSLLYPKHYDISNLQTGKDNPQGLRYAEFPIYNAVQVVSFNIFGVLTLVKWGRIVSIFASLSGAFFVYLLTKKYANQVSALFAAGFYLFMPFSVYYGRVILPDPSMTASILVGIYFFDRWLDQGSKIKSKKQDAKVDKYFILSVFFTALAFLLKPYALIFALPMVYLVIHRFKMEFFKRWELWLFAIITVAPLVFWRIWIANHPEAIPSYSWLLNGDGIRFRPAFFRWIFYERLTKLIFGYVGVLFLVSSFWYVVKNKNNLFFLSFLASSLIYIILIATGNVRHDYYQILIIPTLSMFAGLGASQLVKTISKISNLYIGYGICILVCVVAFAFSWRLVRDYFNINDRGMVEAGIVANKVLPKDAKVLASHDGSTTLLNLIQRPGWPLFEHSLEELISEGANYMVLANPAESDINGFTKNYKTVASGSSYLIIKLK